MISSTLEFLYGTIKSGHKRPLLDSSIGGLFWEGHQLYKMTENIIKVRQKRQLIEEMS